MDPAKERYAKGCYRPSGKDAAFKARQMQIVADAIPDKEGIRSWADVGCFDGSTLAALRAKLLRSGFSLERVVGYDIAPLPENAPAAHPEIEFRQADFLESDECFDLVTLLDVVEHVSRPQEFLANVAVRARYVALHIPLDERASLWLTNRYNFKLQKAGHISFWNASSALNLLVSAGLVPLSCRFTPGFLAPSGRETLVQLLALPVRCVMWLLSKGLTATTVGGVSLAVLCRGRLE